MSGPGPEPENPGPAANGRLAIVTGAASGIGRASALRLLELGYRVAGADVSPEQAGAQEAITGRRAPRFED